MIKKLIEKLKTLRLYFVSGSLHYTIDELDNMKENAKFVIEHDSEIDKDDWMKTVINLVDDCKKLRNDR